MSTANAHKNGASLQAKQRPDIDPCYSGKGILRLKPQSKGATSCWSSTAAPMLDVNDEGEHRCNGLTKVADSPSLENRSSSVDTEYQNCWAKQLPQRIKSMNITQQSTNQSPSPPPAPVTKGKLENDKDGNKRKKVRNQPTANVLLVDIIQSKAQAKTKSNMSTSTVASTTSSNLRTLTAELDQNKGKAKKLRLDGTKKKKKSSLKKAILRDRERRWYEVHPEDKPLAQGESVLTPDGAKNVTAASCTILVKNMISSDEVEDDDEYEELLEDTKDQFSGYGEIVGITIPRKVDQAGEIVISIKYADHSQAQSAVEGRSGRVFGGRKVVVELDTKDNKQESNLQSEIEVPNEVIQEKKTVQITKVPNKEPIREYVSHKMSEDLNSLIIELLGKLMTYQERARLQDPVKAKKSRRLVIGLREVKRGIRTGRIKCVIVASNIDECPSEKGLDENVNEIIQSAQAKDIRVIYALTRRRLGKALGRKVRVSTVGIYSVDGAHDLYSRLKSDHDAILLEDMQNNSENIKGDDSLDTTKSGEIATAAMLNPKCKPFTPSIQAAENTINSEELNGASPSSFGMQREMHQMEIPSLNPFSPAFVPKFAVLQ